jgi:hypothetical protein
MAHETERLSGSVAAPATESAAPQWLRGRVAPRETAGPTLITGHLAGIDDEGRVRFVPEGDADAFPVAIGIEISDGALVRAARRKARAAVMRTADPAARWLLVGLVRDRVAAKARDAKMGRLEVTVDGEKLTLEAEHDIELKCGRASITLRYDGRIELKGTHILSASRGPNRVKGATIALN